MENVTIKQVMVEGINQGIKKNVLVSGKEKYDIWFKKTDGSPTKAFQQFQELGVQAGKVYELAVKEEPKSFTNDQGKLINYTQRTVVYFKTEQNFKSAPPTVPVADFNLKNRVETLEIDVAALKELADPAKLDAQRAMMSAAVPKVNKMLEPELPTIDLEEEPPFNPEEIPY